MALNCFAYGRHGRSDYFFAASAFRFADASFILWLIVFFAAALMVLPVDFAGADLGAVAFAAFAFRRSAQYAFILKLTAFRAAALWGPVLAWLRARLSGAVLVLLFPEGEGIPPLN